MSIPSGSKRILGVNDLRGTPFVDGLPQDLYGKGVVFGYADPVALKIPGISEPTLGTLTVNAMGENEEAITCIHREFQIETTKYIQRAKEGGLWGGWEVHDWDHEGFARLHREQEFTEPQIFGKAIVEAVVNLDLLNESVIDVRLGGVFTKTITEPTDFTVIGEFIEGVTTFALHITDGGLEEVRWWDNLMWPSGMSPSLTPAGTDLLGFMTLDAGISWLGVVLGQNYK